MSGGLPTEETLGLGQVDFGFVFVTSDEHGFKMPVTRLYEVDSCQKGVRKVFLIGRDVPVAAARLTC